MKRLFSIFGICFALILTGCGGCGGSAQLNVYSPWGRNKVLEINEYDVSAERPADSELGGFNLGYFIVGSGKYVSKITKDKENDNLVIENTFSFTGRYFLTSEPDAPVLPLSDSEADWSADGWFTDEYTSTVTLYAGLYNNMRAEHSTRTAKLTAPWRKSADEPWFLRRAEYTQTIEYGTTEAKAKVDNVDLAAQGYREDEILTLHCGANDTFEWTYTYGENDLVYDSETFAAVLRAYSLNKEFTDANASPNSFKVINPRVRQIATMKFSAQEIKHTQGAFSSALYAESETPDAFDTKEVTDAAVYKTSLGLQAGYSGQPTVYYILKDEEVRYHQTDGTPGDARAVNRVVKIEDDMKMVYTLTRYINASAKEPKAPEA